MPAFQTMVANRARMRARVMAEQGIDMGAQHGAPANADVNRGLIHGSPGKVAEAMAAIEAAGAGGVIGAFRLGPMPAAVTNHSLRLFMTAGGAAVQPGAGAGFGLACFFIATICIIPLHPWTPGLRREATRCGQRDREDLHNAYAA